ncbi:triphosphoribosyl-dephospho-CoA synthase [Streptomyces sp. CA-132043]|uniref:triphosphoribosyl-dephospho-CoA synthase n=1 Tax=Streptomyces sp. CA-132043 TaxID=3240048 RepID=UPI003D9337DD
MARLPYDGAPGPADTPGGRARLHFHVPGATGQAHSGFPHIRRVALPALRESRAHGRPETAARMDALLTLMATLDDTSLLHEGGPAALLSVQMDARDVVRAGGYDSPGGRAALDRLHARMRDSGLTPAAATRCCPPPSSWTSRSARRTRPRAPKSRRGRPSRGSWPAPPHSFPPPHPSA